MPLNLAAAAPDAADPQSADSPLAAAVPARAKSAFAAVERDEPEDSAFAPEPRSPQERARASVEKSGTARVLAELQGETFTELYGGSDISEGEGENEAEEDAEPIIKDLTTGEAVKLSTFSAPQNFSKLHKNPVKAWGGWWQQKHTADQKLWSAAESGSIDALRISLVSPSDGTAPAQVNSKSLHGRRALHITAGIGATECVEFLLDKGATVNVKTDSGLTALHMACERGHLDVAQALLDRGIDVNSESDDRSLALHLAAEKGYPAIVQLLLDRGGVMQLGARNARGQNPMETCMNVEVAKVFQSFSSDEPTSSFGSSFSSGEQYSGRGVHGDTVRRNSRPDHVMRLLQLRPGASLRMVDEDAALPEDSFASEAPGTRDGDSSVPHGAGRPSAGRVPGALREGRRAAPFVKVKEGAPSMGQVTPSSFDYVDKLGEGSFGQVFLVEHKVTKEQYAMKVLNRTKMRTSHLRYAITEKNILSYIRHPYIVQLFYSFQTETRLVLVLQYCNGGDVQGLINRERHLPEQLARLYAAEVLLALSHIHVRDIVYRDMKPENVLIDMEGHAMLTDFGLSKEKVVGVEGTKSFCGSLAFIAPELLRKGSAHGRLVDVYGLGVLCYCMMAGVPPYYNKDKETLLANIKTARLRFPATMPTEPQNLIRALMEREPLRRLGSEATRDIGEHPFFESIDFEALLRHEVPVPTRLSVPSKTPGNGPQAGESPFQGNTRAARGGRQEAPPSGASVPHWEYVSASPTPDGGAAVVQQSAQSWAPEKPPTPSTRAEEMRKRQSLQ